MQFLARERRSLRRTPRNMWRLDGVDSLACRIGVKQAASCADNHPPMKPRRLLAAILIVLGAVMLFAAPETLGGLLAIAAGVMIELVGIALEKRR